MSCGASTSGNAYNLLQVVYNIILYVVVLLGGHNLGLRQF